MLVTILFEGNLCPLVTRADQWIFGEEGTSRPAGARGYPPSIIARYPGHLHPSNQHLDRNMQSCRDATVIGLSFVQFGTLSLLKLFASQDRIHTKR